MNNKNRCINTCINSLPLNKDIQCHTNNVKNNRVIINMLNVQ